MLTAQLQLSITDLQIKYLKLDTVIGNLFLVFKQFLRLIIKMFLASMK